MEAGQTQFQVLDWRKLPHRSYTNRVSYGNLKKASLALILRHWVNMLLNWHPQFLYYLYVNILRFSFWLLPSWEAPYCLQVSMVCILLGVVKLLAACDWTLTAVCSDLANVVVLPWSHPSVDISDPLIKNWWIASVSSFTWLCHFPHQISRAERDLNSFKHRVEAFQSWHFIIGQLGLGVQPCLLTGTQHKLFLW